VGGAPPSASPGGPLMMTRNRSLMAVVVAVLVLGLVLFGVLWALLWP
jgi:hypothetical protein